MTRRSRADVVVGEARDVQPLVERIVRHTLLERVSREREDRLDVEVLERVDGAVKPSISTSCVVGHTQRDVLGVRRQALRLNLSVHEVNEVEKGDRAVLRCTVADD